MPTVRLKKKSGTAALPVVVHLSVPQGLMSPVVKQVMLLRRSTQRMAVRLRPVFTCLTRGMILHPGMGIRSFAIGHVLAVFGEMFRHPAVML